MASPSWSLARTLITGLLANSPTAEEIARAHDVVSNLARTFDGLRRRLGPLQIVLGCDCILRTLAEHDSATRARLSALLAANHVVGFNTYGEQFNAMHVNQTFTGIAIGYGLPA